MLFDLWVSDIPKLNPTIYCVIKYQFKDTRSVTAAKFLQTVFIIKIVQ